MAKKAEKIMALLQPYLDTAIETYEAQDGAKKYPTLPLTNDGKINVTKLTKELGLTTNDRQYFFKDRDLADAVNIVAEDQGVLPIGSRKLDDETADAVKAKISSLSKSNKKSNEELIDALHQVDLLTQENQTLRNEIDTLKAQIESIYDTGDILIR